MYFEEARFVPRQQKHEVALSQWRYEGVYAFYNREPVFDAAAPEQLVGADCFAWVDGGGVLLGHVSYGPDGQIPTVEGYAYPDGWLDTGLGLRPDLCGRGLGADFTTRCLRFAQELYGSRRFRLSVAAFNERAIRAYQKAGFSVVCEVTHKVFRNKFYIMAGTLSSHKDN